MGPGDSMTRREALASAVACVGGLVTGCRGLRLRRRPTAATHGAVPRPHHLGNLETWDRLSRFESYPMLIKRLLLEPYPTRVCEMVALPSFELEHSVFLTCT